MYKFYNISDSTIISKIIGAEPTIKFSSAYSLNDPNELKFNFKMDADSPELKERYFIDHPEGKIEEFESWRLQLKDGNTWHKAQQQRQELAMMLTLSCFTDTYDNNLMWSHYTSNHKGICVEYKDDLYAYIRSLPGFCASNKVNYTDEPPEIDLAKEKSEEMIWQMLFNKQDEWSYEKERRIVRISDLETEFIPFPQHMIKRVIIGSRADNQIAKEVLKQCSDSDIEIWWAITMGKTYRVTIKKHKEGTGYMRAFWA